MQNGGFIKELLTKFSTVNESKTAFSLYDGQQITDISYGQFTKDILFAAGYFTQNNICRRHIALAAPNSYKWAVTFFAITASGNIPVLLNPDLPKDMLRHLCKKTDVTMICAENDFYCDLQPDFSQEVTLLPIGHITGAEPLKIENIYSESTGDDTAFLLITSGTTGASKAVEISCNNLTDHLSSFEEIYAMPGMERIYSGFPLYHIGGIVNLLVPLYNQGTFCMGRGIRYIMLDIAKLNPSAILGVPSIAESISKCLKYAKTADDLHKYIGSNLKRLAVGGAAQKPALIHTMKMHGISMEIRYGMTETTGNGTWCVLTEERLNTAGKPLGKTQCRIQDGEILIKGPSVMKGYYKDPDATAKIIKDGWLYTGDLGYIDEDGYLYVTGRKKNVIILSNGENVNPEEIEAKFGECPEILECMVFGDKKGICADVYTKNESASAKFIQNYNWSVPLYRQVYKVNYYSAPLEKTGSGKIKRKENAYV